MFYKKLFYLKLWVGNKDLEWEKLRYFVLLCDNDEDRDEKQLLLIFYVTSNNAVNFIFFFTI